MANRLNRVDLPVSALPRDEKNKSPAPVSVTVRTIPPFILAHDVMRGVLQIVQSALKFMLMFAVMSVLARCHALFPSGLSLVYLRTFQLAFIFSIVIGLGVGETLFGRYASHAAVN